MAKATKVLTPLERRLMRILWEIGPGNVQKVLQGLTGEPQLAYTTVQTTLNVLHRKGRVKRKLVERLFEYSPAVSQVVADSHALEDFLQRVFQGSVDDLLLSLVRSKDLDARKLANLQAKLEATEEEERTTGGFVQPATKRILADSPVRSRRKGLLTACSKGAAEGATLVISRRAGSMSNASDC